MNAIEMALKVAYSAHRGQKDSIGRPYLLHPLAVGLKGDTDNEIIVGILHDVVEDTDYTFEDLLGLGFSTEVVDALRLLTHDKEDTYNEYINRIKQSGNELAIRVKLNDLRHNMSRMDEEHESLMSRYEKALITLEE